MNQTHHIRRITGIIFAAAFLFLYASLFVVPFAHAAKHEKSQLEELTQEIFEPLPSQIIPTLQIDIPTVQLTEIMVNADEVSKGGELRTVSIPWIAQYIGGVYKFAVGIAGALAAVMMMIGGFQYLTAGGDASRVGEAKKRISDALVGLTLTLGVYLILFTLNPDLVELNSLQIQVVKRTEFSLPLDFPENEEASTDEGIPGMATTKSANFKKPIVFNEANIAALESAAQLLVDRTKDKGWGKIQIAGAGARDLDVQARLYRERCIAGTYSGDGASRTYSLVKNQDPGDKSNPIKGRTRCTIPTCSPYKKIDRVTNPDEAHPGKWLKEDATKYPKFCPHTSGLAVDISCSTSSGAIHGIHAPCHLILEQAMMDSGFSRLKSEAWHFELPPILEKYSNFKWTAGKYTEKGTSHDFRGCDGWYDSYSTKKTYGKGSTSDTDRCSPTRIGKKKKKK